MKRMNFFFQVWKGLITFYFPPKLISLSNNNCVFPEKSKIFDFKKASNIIYIHIARIVL